MNLDSVIMEYPEVRAFRMMELHLFRWNNEALTAWVNYQRCVFSKDQTMKV